MCCKKPKIKPIFAKKIFMPGFLFDDLIFGPVYSRRLGISLGINLLPTESKYCNFNCIYCECGWTENGTKLVLPKRGDFKKQLEAKLRQLQGTENEPQSITFAGNGEPTIHPDFAGIIDDTIELRNQFAPGSIISVLSNASMLHKKSVADALKKIDKNIQKLDAGTESTFQEINQPLGGLTLEKTIKKLLEFRGNLIIQTLFVRGKYNGKLVDNTTENELVEWLKIIEKIKPQSVMIYPIDRETPAEGLEKISKKELQAIAKKVEALGICVEVF
jgi:wyosine [tRNA(Phe)-imidazoG37] synthetase (radical SAM superfamily)